MPKFLKKAFAFFLCLFLLVTSLPISRVSALVDSCNANVDLAQVSPGVTTNFVFNLNNTSGTDIVWVRISRPSTNFTLTGASVGGWPQITVTSSNAAFTGGLFVPGGNKNFTLTGVQVANLQAPSANWVVEVSDDNAGANPTSCTGTLGTQIGTPDITPPIISSIQVSNLTYNAAIIRWTTDELSTSKVDYGSSASYGSTTFDATLTTNHSINLSGLAETTGYHYRVVSVDASNNSASSADNTFLTARKPISQPPIVVSLPTGTPVTNPPEGNKSNGDTIPPVVSLSTDLTKVYKDTPEIAGVASDNVQVAAIEFSIDSGINWLPVETVTGLGTKQASFKFKPANLPDGNYGIIVRAQDNSGNIGMSVAKTLVIDKILPVIGPEIVSVGPQIVKPEGNLVHAVKKVDQKITLSTIGGVTSMTIHATQVGSKAEKTFTLTKSNSSDLWSGILAFDTVGDYKLEAKAIDGAENIASRGLGSFVVDQTSAVVAKDTEQPINNAKVTLNYFDDETASWVVWDAASFGEKNPQYTSGTGEFNFYTPAGKYYLGARAAGFKDLTSEIFVLKEGTNLSVTLKMDKQTSFKLGNLVLSFPDFSFGNYKLVFNKIEKPSAATSSLIGADLPSFNFPSTSGSAFNSLDLLGKESLITFITTWDPSTEEQIAQLENLEGKGDFNLIRISVLESEQKLAAYQSIAGYSGNFLADPSGISLSKFNIHGLPTNIFVSRAGKVKQILNGVLTTDQLRYNLEN